MDMQELFTQMTQEGADKNAIIMALATQCGVDVTTAVREYQRMAKASGLVLSSKERTIQIDLMLADYDVTDTNVRRQLVETIADKFDISEATAMQHIRSYAETNGIELPSVARTSLEDLTKFVKERIDEGKVRADIVKALTDELGYSENSANSAYSRATRELGLSTGRAGATFPLDQLVTLIRDNAALPKKQLVHLIVEQAGYAESTANSFLIYHAFAKEYAKQELEAAGTKPKRSKKDAEAA